MVVKKMRRKYKIQSSSSCREAECSGILKINRFSGRLVDKLRPLLFATRALFVANAFGKKVCGNSYLHCILCSLFQFDLVGFLLPWNDTFNSRACLTCYLTYPPSVHISEVCMHT